MGKECYLMFNTAVLGVRPIQAGRAYMNEGLAVDTHTHTHVNTHSHSSSQARGEGVQQEVK